jgi:hypothetical protein
VIVTRRRKPQSHPGRYLIPLAVLAVLGFLLGWPPSQRVIANGPLRPIWNAGVVVTRPLSFAGQQQTITDRNREIRDLNDRLERQRLAKADADARAQQQQQQVTALANQPHAAPVVLPRAAATPGFGSASASAGAPSGDEKRLAATWSAMEPERAAAVVQRLPDDEVVRVLAAMDADSAGAIMNALPASVAARISRAVAQVQPASSR